MGEGRIELGVPGVAVLRIRPDALEGREVVAAWKAKRQMAEQAGGTFIVKAKVDADGTPVFGKRQNGPGASGATNGSAAGWLARTFKVHRDND